MISVCTGSESTSRRGFQCGIDPNQTNHYIQIKLIQFKPIRLVGALPQHIWINLVVLRHSLLHPALRPLPCQNQTWWSGPSTITDRARSFQKRPSISLESKQCLLASIGPFNTIFLPRKCVSANRVTVIPGGMSTDDRSALGRPQFRSTHSPWSSSHVLVPIVAYLPLRPRTEKR